MNADTATINVDLSPAEKFKQHDIPAGANAPIGLADGTPLTDFSTFLGGEPQRSYDDAVHCFNDMFDNWLDTLPSDAELHWSRKTRTVRNLNPAVAELEWRIACHVIAMVEGKRAGAPTNTDLAEAEEKRQRAADLDEANRIAAEAAAREELRLMASAGVPLFPGAHALVGIAGTPEVTQAKVDAALGQPFMTQEEAGTILQNLTPLTVDDINDAVRQTDIGDAPNAEQLNTLFTAVNELSGVAQPETVAVE